MVDKKKIYNILKRFRVKSYRTSEEGQIEQVEYPISREMLAEIIAKSLNE